MADKLKEAFLADRKLLLWQVEGGWDAKTERQRNRDMILLLLPKPTSETMIIEGTPFFRHTWKIPETDEQVCVDFKYDGDIVVDGTTYRAGDKNAIAVHVWTRLGYKCVSNENK